VDLSHRDRVDALAVNVRTLAGESTAWLIELRASTPEPDLGPATAGATAACVMHSPIAHVLPGAEPNADTGSADRRSSGRPTPTTNP
jgi:hypothetical protein